MQNTAEAIQKDAAERREKWKGIAPATKRSIAVLTPTLGQVSMFWHSALVDLVWPMNMGKAFIPTMDTKGNEIGQMRNRLVSMALSFAEQQGIDLEAIMWVDDDVIVSKLAMVQLCTHDRDIASGVYFAKGEPEAGPLIFAGASCGTMPFKPGETFEAYGWSQGLCLIRPQVYRRMKDELDLGTDSYGNPNWYKVPEFGVDEHGCLTVGGTEDFHFFENASKLGYRPLIDCTKFAFAFHYDAATRTGFPKMQWNQWIRREPIIWPANRHHPEVIWS
jgi:hypothetical protein